MCVVIVFESVVREGDTAVDIRRLLGPLSDERRSVVVVLTVGRRPCEDVGSGLGEVHPIRAATTASGALVVVAMDHRIGLLEVETTIIL